MYMTMKKRIFLLLAGLLFTGLISAQQADTLTNNAIIRMEKANLEDEVIMDVIRGSAVNFDLSETGIRKLRDANVSFQVIEAMEAAQPGSGSPLIKEPTKPLDEPDKKPEKQGEKTPGNKGGGKQGKDIGKSPEKSTPPISPQPTPGEKQKQVIPASAEKPFQTPSSMDAYGYVAPLAELVRFYENEFDIISNVITDWNKQIELSLIKINDLDRLISVTEDELRLKKNRNSGSFTPEINTLIQRLTAQRNSYKQFKTDLVATGKKIAEQSDKLFNERSSAIKNKYSEVSNNVKAANSDPSKAQDPVRINFSPLTINESINSYITPATELLYWYQNSIQDIRQLAVSWNARVEAVIAKDAEIAAQLNPLLTKMEEYKASPKQYKTEISALKKQISGKEKERKQIADQMENDARELSDQLKTDRSVIQKTFEERFTDIMNNISYTFQERLKI